eukprot:COSAG06_NODE_98_length_24155_cov_29.681784_11_plen_47_part_00
MLELVLAFFIFYFIFYPDATCQGSAISITIAVPTWIVSVTISAIIT